MLYVTSPNTGNVYVKISSHDKVDLFNMPPGGEIKYFIGNDDNSKLVINSDGLGRNLDNKGFIVEGFSDELYTTPTSIFVETRVQVGNVSGNQRMQSNSSFIKGDLAPGKNFRLGHGVFDRMDEYRRAFVTFMAIEEGTTQVTVSNLKEGWEPFYYDFGLGDLDFEIIDGDYVFSFDKNQSHAIALNIDQDDPIENKDALIGALVSSDKDIVVNVGYWGGANSWGGFGRDVGYDQIKPTNHISNEYIFLSAAGQHAVGGDITSSLEYAIIVAHEDSTKIWIDTPISDTSSVTPNYTINKGDYKVLYYQNSEDYMYVISNKRVYGYQNMAGNDDGPQDAAMMLISGINPLASNKIDGIYNIQDIAGVNFDMKLKILTKTDADLNLNNIPHDAFSFNSGVIEGKEEFSFYEFSEADVNTIISTKPSKRLIIESDGPVYGMYYGHNSPQGIAGYFFSFSDFDNDGISDSDDLDDDNDGILDIWELDEDTDSDGLINRYDLDSDGDGCYDVVEAGYTDQDDNGILGYGETDEVIVDDLGKVIKNDDLTDVIDGYTLPNDLDINSIPDFRQFGFQLEIIKQPEDIMIVESCPDYIENPPFFEVDANGVYVSYLWQVSEDSGNTWTRIFDTESYDGITDQKLKIINSDLNLSSNLYRAILSSKGYLCGMNDTSKVAKVTVLPDNDKDCISDIDDLDDDNDGILDTVEDSLDNDSDGIPNYFDLDSDGDGCFDVIEAGFLDNDSDGYLGNSPVTVDTLGKVISSSDGYETPGDLDNNSIYDFLDYGSEPIIIIQPLSKMTSNVGEVYFFVSATSDSKLNYQWEVSTDFGDTWVYINNDTIYNGANNDTLKINNLSFDMDSYRYRVIISTPSYLCAEDLISNWVFLMVRPDNDRDGIFDDMDVDDDNDGIYDSIELSCESNRFIEDFGQGDYTSTPYTNYDYAAEGVVSDGSYTIASNTTNWFNNWLEFSDHTGNPNGRMFICNAQYDPGKYFYKRRIDGLNLNVPYEVSFWLKDIIRMYHVNTGNLNSHIPPNVTFEVYAITDNEQGDLLYKYNTGNVPRDEKWHEYRFNFNNLENSSIEIVLSSEQPGGYGNDFALDDIEFNSGCYEDIDADGIINSFDLDTDGDGCSDVLEAGFDDFDMDSLLGDSPFIVDIWGRVVGENGGYLIPYDKDSSGVYDFKEYGISSVFISHPQSDSLIENDTSSLHVSYSPPSSLIKWQISYDSGISWVNIDSLENFSGQDTDTLRIYNLSLDMDQYRFRAYVFNSAFVCGDTIFSEISTISVLPDNDKDGVADIYDLDDDNDGIFDMDEGMDDIDGDGIINSFDLDTDGDGCNDVIEGGFSDDDNDGILCNSPVIVDSLGVVIACDGQPLDSGYTDPVDLDDNGIKDYKELSDNPIIITHPDSVEVTLDNSVFFTVNASVTGTLFYQWQFNMGGGWINLSENSSYKGVNTDTLIIENVTQQMDGTIYRVVVSNITLLCSEEVYSNNALLSVLPDNDRDNIPDIIDLDDDNDGILDTHEGIFDKDDDGIPNHFDLDSDGDGCYDVIEAGFFDEDYDGILGVNPITVDSLGLVISSSIGYSDPLDRDTNGIDDFMELGSPVVIKSNPSSVSIIETRNARYEVEVIAEGTLLYQWQSSEDSGATWLNISDDLIYSGSNTSVLTLTNAPIEFNDYQFRVNISTPAFVCDTDIFSSVVLTVLPDNDRDGIADEDDLDDDNDGILDIYEGNSDIDGDGIINSFDLDSDGDGCFDVNEIGCYDPDGDGIVGLSPAKVDGLGLVIDNYVLKLDFSKNFEDLSVNNLTVIDNGVNLTNDRFGILSNASLFDGVDDYISIEHDSILSLGRYDRFSISMWIKFDDTLDLGESFSFIQKQSSDSSWNYEYTSDTSYYLNFEIKPQNIKISKEIIPFNTGQWYHIVLQKRGNNYTHYIDGDTIFSVVDSTIIGNNLEKILIGGSPILKNWYSGIIDDIVISGDFESCNYSVPYDNDLNGVYDFLDFGSDAIINTISSDKEITENTNTFFAISSVSESDIIFQWQFSEDGGTNWVSIDDTTFFDGFRADTLIIKNSPLYFSNYIFRVLVSTPSYQCGTTVVSDSMILKVLPDNDLDGISDIDDLDDDNDGIYDTYEGIGDFDGDGLINQFDLDSDGDGCYDAIEAGFTDHNNDGILGDSIVLVDEKGLVTTGIDGYTQPVDRDSNFIPDYLEFGSQARIIVEPYDIFIVERSDSSVSVIADVSDGNTKLFYLWQVSENGGMTWEGLANTSNIFDVINSDVSYSDRIFRVIVSTPSYMCGDNVISDPFRIIVTNDFDIDLVGNFEDVDDDNDGIYDSIECYSNGSLIISGDVDSVYSSSYPLIGSFSEKSGIGDKNDLFRYDVDVSMSFGNGDIYEGCYIESDINFDDGIYVEVDGKTILYFNQHHWDVLSGKADPEITKEFNNGGIFAKDQNKWKPWSENFDIKLFIRDGSIKLLSRISSGEMVDIIPYMDNKVDGWILDKNFNISCKDGFNIVIGNTNHDGPSKFDHSTKVIAYVCNDVDDDGNLNNKDLDSDDDNCYDVSEAGFIDKDNDGILSKSPVKIDSLGRVIEDLGYKQPLDNDNNGILDFMEKGFEINIISQPVNYILVKEGDTLSLTVDVDLLERFSYQWQVRDEFTLFWKDLEDTIIDGSFYQGSKTNKLNIFSSEFDPNQIDNIHMFYRLIISSPAYLCEDDITTEAFEIEFYHKDLHIPNGFSPNNDGINDIWVIRGIEAYPKNKVRVYNRWNNRVYEKKGYSNDWDGTNQMQLYFGDGRLPEGTYFYIFDLGNGSNPLTGFVFIKRE